VAITNQDELKNDFAIHIPWVMGIIGTRSFDKQLTGIHDLIEINKGRIGNGVQAYLALQKFKADPADTASKEFFLENWRDLGYGLLLKKYRNDIDAATPEQIHQAALDTVPDVAPLFYAFRIMVALGFYFVFFFGMVFLLTVKDRIAQSSRVLKLAMITVAGPYIAVECGWLVAEYGRQPWVIDGVLPTHYAVSHLSETSLWISLAIYFVLYSSIFALGLKVMLSTIKKGPEKMVPADSASVLTGELPAKAAV
jgi:cytochrome d ubiquinol oxidase subunit I